MKRDHTEMRVLMPVLHYPPVIGGIEVFLKNIGERLGRRMDIVVLTGRVAGAPAVEHHGRLVVMRRASLTALRDRSYSSYWYVLPMLPVLFVLALYYALRLRVTVLHGHGFLSGVVCLLVHALTRVPYVMTIQSADFTIYHPEVHLNLLVRSQAWLERLVYRYAAVCHAVSRDLCEHYRQQGRDDCVRIPNGVDTEHHHPVSRDVRQKTREHFGILPRAFVAVTVGRLEPKAGLFDLIDAFGIFSKEKKNAHLVVVGDGSLRRLLEERVRERGLERRVHFAGEQSYADVGPIVASSDVFIRTPRSEGFGIVFIEAMAAGIPVIGTSVGGIPDFIKDGETGLLVSSGEPAAAAHALHAISNDATLAARLGERGRALVKKEYDWDVIAKKISMLYNKVNT